MSKNIFDLSPGLEEKMRTLLGKYEESLKRRELKNEVKEISSVTVENYNKSINKNNPKYRS